MLITVVAPTVEPVTLVEAKEHLRVTHEDDDALIDVYISAAREAVELHTGRALAAGTYRWVYEGEIGYINRLPLWPVATITAVTYEDYAGARVAFTGYILDADRSEMSISTLPYGRAISVTFTVAPTFVPAALKAAILLMVTDLYEQAGGVVVGVSVSTNPTIDRLIWPHRVDLGV